MDEFCLGHPMAEKAMDGFFNRLIDEEKS